MRRADYTDADLMILRQAFDEALREMMQMRVDIPTSAMTRRIFDAADAGERDISILKGRSRRIRWILEIGLIGNGGFEAHGCVAAA